MQQALIKRRKKIDVLFNTPFIDKANKTIVRIFSKARLRISRKRVRRLVLRNLIVSRKYCHNGYKAVREKARLKKNLLKKRFLFYLGVPRRRNPSIPRGYSLFG